MSIAQRIATSNPGALPPPPHAALAGCEAGSFAEATITARLPAILASMISDIETDMAARHAGDAAALQQVASGLDELRALRRAVLADAPLTVLHVPGAPEATQALLDAANACLQLGTQRLAQQQQGASGSNSSSVTGAEGATWLRLPWLLVECYMYGAIHAALQRQPALAGYDPFTLQKAAAWAKSAAAAADLAAETQQLLRLARPAGSDDANTTAGPSGTAQQQQQQRRDADRDGALLEALFSALWGNKADLSLHVSADGLDSAVLAGRRGGGGGGGGAAASSGSSARPEGAAAPGQPPPRVIVDDADGVVALLGRLAAAARRNAETAAAAAPGAAEAVAAAAAAAAGGGAQTEAQERQEGQQRVDIVLDNSGLELFADLCLADVLLEAGAADRIVLHGKAIPWFVSDTLEADVELLLASCEAEAPPQGAQGVSSAAWAPVRALASRWRRHLASGRWAWAAHGFWTTPAPFAWMAAAAPDLYGSLAGSCLVVLKGDLNYRKLAHDCRWPHTTSFTEALQGFRPAPLVALRTCKADVVVGLATAELSAVLDAADSQWQVNGKWGMVQAAL